MQTTVTNQPSCTVSNIVSDLPYRRRRLSIRSAARPRFTISTLEINKCTTRLLKHLNGGVARMLFLNEPISAEKLERKRTLIGSGHGVLEQGVASC